MNISRIVTALKILLFQNNSATASTRMNVRNFPTSRNVPLCNGGYLYFSKHMKNWFTWKGSSSFPAIHSPKYWTCGPQGIRWTHKRWAKGDSGIWLLESIQYAYLSHYIVSLLPFRPISLCLDFHIIFSMRAGPEIPFKRYKVSVISVMRRNTMQEWISVLPPLSWEAFLPLRAHKKLIYSGE